MKAKLRRLADFIIGNLAGLLWVLLVIAGGCWRTLKRQLKRLLQRRAERHD